MARQNAYSKTLGKPPLARELKLELKKHRYTFALVAKHLNISADSLRGWINRNRFPEEHLRGIAELARLPTDMNALANRYEFELQSEPAAGFALPSEPKLSEALAVMDNRLDDLRKIYADFGHDVLMLFNALGPSDAFVYIALDELPYEVDGVGWNVTKEKVINAIRRGCLFRLSLSVRGGHHTDPGRFSIQEAH